MGKGAQGIAGGRARFFALTIALSLCSSPSRVCGSGCGAAHGRRSPQRLRVRPLWPALPSVPPIYPFRCGPSLPSPWAAACWLTLAAGSGACGIHGAHARHYIWKCHHEDFALIGCQEESYDNNCMMFSSILIYSICMVSIILLTTMFENKPRFSLRGSRGLDDDLMS